MLTWAVVSLWKHLSDLAARSRGQFQYGLDIPVMILAAIVGDVLIALLLGQPLVANLVG